jgi:hypothetical protein
MKALILIFVTVAVEVIMAMIVVKNPEKMIGNGKIDNFVKIFVFIMISLLIISTTCLTLGILLF